MQVILPLPFQTIYYADKVRSTVFEFVQFIENCVYGRSPGRRDRFIFLRKALLHASPTPLDREVLEERPHVVCHAAGAACPRMSVHLLRQKNTSLNGLNFALHRSSFSYKVQPHCSSIT